MHDNNIIGNIVKDSCHPHGSEFSEEYATYTQNQCLKICETRMVTGGEYRDVPPNPECIVHTKYIIDARGHQPGDEKYTCWKFERSTYDSCLTSLNENFFKIWCSNFYFY